MPLPMWPCTLPLGKSLQEGEPKREHEKKNLSGISEYFPQKRTNNNFIIPQILFGFPFFLFFILLF